MSNIAQGAAFVSHNRISLEEEYRIRKALPKSIRDFVLFESSIALRWQPVYECYLINGEEETLRRLHLINTKAQIRDYGEEFYLFLWRV